MVLVKRAAVAKKKKPKPLAKIKAGGIKKKKRPKKAPATKKAAKAGGKKDRVKKVAVIITKKKKPKPVTADAGKKNAPKTKKVAEVASKKAKSPEAKAKKDVKPKSPAGKKDVKAKSLEAKKAKSRAATNKSTDVRVKKDVKPKSKSPAAAAKKDNPPEAKKDMRAKSLAAKKAATRAKLPAAKKETKKAKSPAFKKETKKPKSPTANKAKSPAARKAKKDKTPESKKVKSPAAKGVKKAKSPAARKARKDKTPEPKKVKSPAAKEAESPTTSEGEEATSPAAKKRKKKNGKSKSHDTSGTSGKSSKVSSKSRSKSSESRGTSRTSGKSSKGSSKSRSKSSKSGDHSGSRKKKGKGRKGRSRSKKRKGKKGRSKKRTTRSKKHRGKKSRSRKRKKKKRRLEEGELEESLLLEANELNLRHYSVNGELYDFRLLSTLPKICGDWMILVIDDPLRVKEILDEELLADQQLFGTNRELVESEEEQEIGAKEGDSQKMVTVNEHEQIFKDKVTKKQDEIELRTRWEKKGDKKLLSITVVLPEHAIWFEKPIPVRWNSELRIWSTDAFFDVKFLPLDISVRFSTDVSGVFGFAADRWINLPYRGWKLESAENGLVKFTLQAKLITVKFTVRDDLICVNALTEGPAHSPKVEEKLLNVYMKPRDLIKTLRECGINVFPEHDSHTYMVEGVLTKQADIEDRLYQCIAIVYPAYHLSWSKWNSEAGRDKIVLQAQSKTGTGESGNVLNTSSGSTFVSCTEESKAFSDAPRSGTQLRADLLNLVKAFGGPDVNELIPVTETDNDAGTSTSKLLPTHAEAVRLLLHSVRPLSYSA